MNLAARRIVPAVQCQDRRYESFSIQFSELVVIKIKE